MRMFVRAKARSCTCARVLVYVCAQVGMHVRAPACACLCGCMCMHSLRRAADRYLLCAYNLCEFVPFCVSVCVGAKAGLWLTFVHHRGTCTQGIHGHSFLHLAEPGLVGAHVRWQRRACLVCMCAGKQWGWQAVVLASAGMQWSLQCPLN